MEFRGFRGFSFQVSTQAQDSPLRFTFSNHKQFWKPWIEFEEESREKKPPEIGNDLWKEEKRSLAGNPEAPANETEHRV